MNTNATDIDSTDEKHKETLRIWYEFLQRALHHKNHKVDLQKYAQWKLKRNQPFEKWWSISGRNVLKSILPATPFECTNFKSDISSEKYYLIAIPRQLTATDAGNYVRKLLLNKQVAHVKSSISASLSKDSEIRHNNLRKYLFAYDCHQKLLEEFRDERVSGANLLSMIRKSYLDNNISPNLSERMPPALYGQGRSPDSYEYIYSDDDSQAIAAARRYVKKANQIILNVEKGHFP